jgi:hypothetical protein
MRENISGSRKNQSFKPGEILADGKIPGPYSILIEKNLLSEKELQKAFKKAEKDERSLETILIENYDLSRKQLGKALAEYYNIGFEDLNTTIYNPIDYIKGKNIDFFLRGLWVPLGAAAH